MKKILHLITFFLLAGIINITAQTTITVQNLNDAGTGSLRQAITTLNAGSGGTIQFAAGLSGGTITLTSTLPNIDKNMTIEGNGITISGNNLYRIIVINESKTVSISRVHFTKGKTTSYGGAIAADRLVTLVLKSCIFSFNQANSGGGSGITTSQGSLLTVSGCTFYGNSDYEGGVIICDESTVNYTGNLFYGNTSNDGYLVGNYSYEAISGGYNVYDHSTSANYYFNASGDKQLPAGICPLSPNTFKVRTGGGATNVIPNTAILSGYPTVDFYGTSMNRSVALAAGAVQGTTIGSGYILAYSTQGSGTISQTSGASPNADGLVLANSTISLKATPNTGRNFMYWMVNGVRSSETSDVLQLTMNEDKIVQAIFGRTITVANLNNDGVGSLRQAITDLNTDGGNGNKINFSNSLAGKIIVLNSMLPVISTNMDIEGNGVTLSGNNLNGIMYINTAVSVNVKRVHFTQGNRTGSNGGAINNFGNLNLQSCIFSYNQAATGSAIYNSGSLIVSGCTFYANGGSLVLTGVIDIGQRSTCKLTGNLFYNNNGRIIWNGNFSGSGGTVTSGGYNMWDTESNFFSFDANKGDKQLNEWIYPMSPVTFKIKPGGGADGIIPSIAILDAYPAVDFYGTTINRSKTLAAGAVQGTVSGLGYSLTTSVQGPGTVNKTSGPSIDADGLISANSTVTLQATPETNKNFMHWIVNGEKSTEISTTLNLKMDGDKTVQAVFGRTITVSNINNAGTGSLRQAIIDLNAEGGVGIIKFATTLTGQNIALSSSLPAITGNMTIEGNGIGLLGDNSSVINRILEIRSSAVVTINQVRFAKGRIGAMTNSGTLTLLSCIFDNNNGVYGGAIYNSGILTVKGCTFYANTGNPGGAIYNTNGYDIDGNCTLIGNLFYNNGTNNTIHCENGTVTSGGYNVWDKTSYNFSFDANKGDKQVTSDCLNPATFIPTTTGNAQLKIVPAGLAGFPETDFYGTTRGVPGAAGAVVMLGKEVTFNWQYIGSVSTIVNVEANTCLAVPVVTTRVGFTFGGWYKEAACTNAWNFSTQVTNDMTLYAKWYTAATSILLGTKDLALNIGNSSSLSATVAPVGADPRVTWVSRHSGTAEIISTSADGKSVTVFGWTDGVTYIVASTANGLRDSCRVQVGIPVTDLLMDQPALALIKNTSTTLLVHTYPDNASYNGLVWKSRNTSVATVDATGKVTAADISEGQTYIVVSTIDGSQKDSCLVTVTDHATRINLQSTLAIAMGESYQLTATVTPSLPVGTVLEWRSRNPDIIEVDATGKVTALADGKTLIFVIYDGQTASCEVSVKQRIIGTVTGIDQALLNGIVYAYRTWVINGQKRNVIAPVEISLTNGQFEVDLAAGRYYFQAISANLNYIPGYYGNINSESGLSPIKWDDPDIIVEELPSATTSLDIVLGKVSGDNISGQEVVLEGNVDENKPDEYTKSTMARPVAYATIILYGKSKSKSSGAMNADDDGYQKLMQVQSDEYGNFTFGELSKSYHYKVHIEVTGYSFEQLLSINDTDEGQRTTYTVTAEANFDQEEVIAVVSRSTSARIEDQVEAKLYPNPATDMVRITMDTDAPYTIRIFNSLGQQVSSTNGNSRETMLDVNHLKAGVYFVRIEAGGKTGTYKLIKN